jgi:hypothetical protein
MPSQEHILREQYTTLTAAFTKAFPHVTPPDADWWIDWMQRYDSGAIHEAIITLARHPLRAQFTQSSCGKALTSLLRQQALKRAIINPAPKEQS